MPPALAAAGYNLTDPGRYQNLTDDFSAQINAFKAANCDIMVGIPIPPDFTTFWTQARSKASSPSWFRSPRRCSSPKASRLSASLGHNLTCEVWWSPNHPFKSSLTGETCAELAAGFEAAAGRQWTHAGRLCACAV